MSRNYYSLSLVALAAALPLLLTAAVLTVRSAPPAAPPISLEPTAQYGGSAFGVAVAGNYAYLGRGARLEIFDVQDPANPNRVWQSDIRSGIVGQGQLLGNLLLIEIDDTLTLFDITNPTQPIEQGSYAPPGILYDFYASGDHAYIAEGRVWNGATYDFGGVRVVDIADPANPQEVAVYDAGETINDIVVTGNYAYATKAYGGSTGVVILDVSTPAAISEVTIYDQSENFTGIATDGAYLYLVSSSNEALNIQSLANPTAPASLGWETFPRNPYRVAVAGTLVFVSSPRGVYIVDASNTASPTHIGQYEDHISYGQDIAIAGNHLYVAYDRHGLRIADVTAPATPVEVGSFDPFSGIVGTAVQDQLLYAYDFGKGLRIYDFSSPTNPNELSFTAGAYGNIVVRDAHAYHGLFGTFRTTDISDPSNPVPGGDIALPGSLFDIAVDDDYAYIADSDYGLVIADISDPISPTVAGAIHLVNAPFTIALYGEYAILGTGFRNSIEIVDISIPSLPNLTGSYPITDSQALAVTGTHLFAGSDHSGIFVFDIATPSSPAPVGFVPIAAEIRDITINGSTLYIAAYHLGVYAVDISDPSNPTIIDHFDTGGVVGNLTLADDYLFAIDWDNGLYVFGEAPPVDLGAYMPVLVRP